MPDYRTTIQKLLKQRESVTAPEVAEAIGVSRQYAHTLLSGMLRTGEVYRIGHTRGARYFKSLESIPVQGSYISTLKNADLKEHEVLQEIRDTFIPLRLAQDNVRSIFDYTFSEMLNNAIEHSESNKIEIEVATRGGTGDLPAMISFTVRDRGIGAFRNIMKSRNLASVQEAMQDLLKGKTTTAPEAHSGEGIFFTSKAADTFTLRSYDWELRTDNILNDVFFSKLENPVEGTEVSFSLAYKSARHLIDIFKAYETDPESQGFDRTEILVRLYTHGTIHVSRSQAKRILFGLERFKRITLDFARVPTIGQAFADEIFRVFQKSHPDIEIEYENANEAVAFMIERVEKPPRNQENLGI